MKPTPIDQIPEYEDAWRTAVPGRAYDPNTFDRITESQEKKEIRQRFVDSVRPGATTFTLPGLSWKTEVALANAGVERLIACEHHEATFLRQAGYVVRGEGGLEHWKDEASGYEYYETDKSTLFFADVNQLLMSDRACGPLGDPSRQARRRWENFRKKYAGWDAAWIDYCGPLSVRHLLAISKLHWWMNWESEEPLPVDITFLGSREQPETTRLIKLFGGRFRLLHGAMSNQGTFNFELIDKEVYKSGTARLPMHHFHGRLVPKPKATVVVEKPEREPAAASL